MALQIGAIVLGIVGLVLFYAGVAASLPVLILALVIFIGLDIYGLMSGRLGCSPFTFLPVLPALFVHPWFVGLAWGFVVIALFDVAMEKIRL